MPISLVAGLALMSAVAIDDGHAAQMELSGQRPMVEVRFGDHDPVWMIFDTGASGSLILPQFATMLDLPDLGEAAIQSGAGGDLIPVRRTELSGHVGGYEFTGTQAVVADIPLPPSDRPIAGILSPRAFADGRLLSLNFATGAISLADEDAAIPEGSPSPFEGDQRPLPSVHATFNGVQRLCHIDTGAPGTLTLPWQDREAFAFETAPVQSGMATLANGQRPIYRAQLSGDVQIAFLTLQDPEVHLLEGIRGCNIGMGLLNQFVVTLDFENRQVWVAPADG